MTPRRYIAVIQDARGYPAPGDPLGLAPPDGPAQPQVVSVVKADDYEELKGAGHALEEAARKALSHLSYDGPNAIPKYEAIEALMTALEPLNERAVTPPLERFEGPQKGAGC